MPRIDPPKKVSISDAERMLAPILGGERKRVPANIPLPPGMTRDATGLDILAPKPGDFDESALAPILSKWVQQRQFKPGENIPVTEYVKAFVKFAATEGYPKSLTELKEAVSWIFDPNASIEEMPPHALLADLFLGFLPGVGELQAGRDVYRDVSQGATSGWTTLAAVGMLPLIPNLEAARVAAKNAERAAKVMGETSRLGREVRAVRAASEEMIRAFDPRQMVQFGQRVTSEGTSLAQVPAIFASKGDAAKWVKGGVNLDLGGGAHDLGTASMRERGIQNILVDPHARDVAHNTEQLHLLAQAGGADTATLSNVLNVIDSPEARAGVLQQARDALKEGGELYVTVHEGAKTGVAGPTSKGWQENRRVKDYIDEVVSVFGAENVSIKNGVITARAPTAGRFAAGPALLTTTMDTPALAERMQVLAGFEGPPARVAHPDVARRLAVEPAETISRQPTTEELQQVERRLKAAEQGGVRPYVEALRGESLAGVKAETFDKAQKLWDAMNPEQIASVALAGSRKRGWYNSAGKMIRKMFGEDTPRFVGLLAATSPQTSVEANLTNSLRVWRKWEEMGRPTDPKVIRKIMADMLPATPIDDRTPKNLNKMLARARDEYDVDLDKLAEGLSLPEGWKVGEQEGTLTKAEALAMLSQIDEGTVKDLSVLDAWYNNTVRALTGSEDDVFETVLSGAKVDSFMRNLLGDEWAATLDTHMARSEAINQQQFGGSASDLNLGRGNPGMTFRYMGAEARYAQVADMLTQATGEVWTPAQVQESVWTVSKALADFRDTKIKTLPQNARNSYTFGQALLEMPAENLENVATFGAQLGVEDNLREMKLIDEARRAAGRTVLGAPGEEQLAPLQNVDWRDLADYSHLEDLAEKMDRHRMKQFFAPAVAGALGYSWLTDDGEGKDAAGAMSAAALLGISPSGIVEILGRPAPALTRAARGLIRAPEQLDMLTGMTGGEGLARWAGDVEHNLNMFLGPEATRGAPGLTYHAGPKRIDEVVPGVGEGLGFHTGTKGQAMIRGMYGPSTVFSGTRPYKMNEFITRTQNPLTLQRDPGGWWVGDIPHQIADAETAAGVAPPSSLVDALDEVARDYHAGRFLDFADGPGSPAVGGISENRWWGMSPEARARAYMADAMRNEGFDALAYPNEFEVPKFARDYRMKNSDLPLDFNPDFSYALLNPTQVKSLNNRGTFSLIDPNVYR